MSDDDDLGTVLARVRTIAVVGASANEARPSFMVSKYLIAKGYSVFPINPGQVGNSLCGRPFLARLSDVPEAIDLLDVFRASEAVPGVLDEALALPRRPGVLWLQLGVRHPEAEERARASGLTVVADRCVKIEYGRHSGEIGWAGVNSGRLSAKKPIRAAGYQALGLTPVPTSRKR